MVDFEKLTVYFSSVLKEENKNLSKRVPNNLYEPISYSLDMGGKRIRPVLLLMSYQLFKTDFKMALPAAIAIELFHNFTLLHDDIMDHASIRRNQDTVHIKYSTNSAILSGDAMSILSYEYLTKCKSPNISQILELFTITALKVCEGQQFDMDFEKRDIISVDDYLNMIGLKTAVLLAASLKLGALIADAPENEANFLYEFGYNLGLAFQLQDDLLDTFGDEKIFGKNIGGDIVSNKKTYLLLSALKMGDSEQRKELHKWLMAKDFDRDEKIRNVKRVFDELHIESITNQQIDYYFKAAFNSWENIKVEPEKKECLMTVANLLMNRKN